MEFFATAAFGLEGMVKQELLDLGFDAKAQPGGARFEADMAGAFYANLWLACADRVLLVVGEKEVTSFEALFDFVISLPWENYLPVNAAFPVSGNCARSQLMSVSDCQSIAKKAVVERLKQKYKVQWFEESGSLYPISVTLHNNVARLSLDTSGEALNRRGYRTWNGEAPIRETLAAALVRMSAWKAGQPLHDPCCGTGTLLIEAAYYASGRASGLSRRFLMENWQLSDPADHRKMRGQANALFNPSAIEHISGSDIDPNALDLCRRHIKQAGIDGRVSVCQKDLRELRLSGPAPFFLANPPYGTRLGDSKSTDSLNRAIGELIGRHFGSRLGVISATPTFEKSFGRRAASRRRLYNGRLECEFLLF